MIIPKGRTNYRETAVADVTFTVTEPVTGAKPGPTYVAVMRLFPRTRLVPLIRNFAVAVDPDPMTATAPRVVFPAANVTLPVGGFVAEDARTVTANCVDADRLMMAGLAVRVMLAVTNAVVATFTITEDAAPPTPPAGV